MTNGRPPWLKRTKRTVRAVALRWTAALVSLLPARLASALGAAVGHLAFALAVGERAKALASLAVAFPERSVKARRALARASFAHLGRCALELACARQLDADIEAWVDWPPDARATLDAAIAKGRGVLFVSGHVGSWELLARRVSLAGYPCQTIAKEASDPLLTALVERARASARLRTIWRGTPGAAVSMLRALKRGELLGLLIDQDTKVQSVFVPFFGRLAKTPRAVADLALRTGAAVVLGFCPRVAPFRYRLELCEVPVPGAPPEAVGPVEQEARAVALTAQLTAGIEAAIRAHPEQWVWMHQRWRSRPEALAPLPQSSPQLEDTTRSPSSSSAAT